jgi:hypothetical protein
MKILDGASAFSNHLIWRFSVLIYPQFCSKFTQMESSFCSALIKGEYKELPALSKTRQATVAHSQLNYMRLCTEAANPQNALDVANAQSGLFHNLCMVCSMVCL